MYPRAPMQFLSGLVVVFWCGVLYMAHKGTTKAPLGIRKVWVMVEDCAHIGHAISTKWVVVKIMVPFWVHIRHLIFRVPKKGQ